MSIDTSIKDKRKYSSATYDDISSLKSDIDDELLLNNDSELFNLNSIDVNKIKKSRRSRSSSRSKSSRYESSSSSRYSTHRNKRYNDDYRHRKYSHHSRKSSKKSKYRRTKSRSRTRTRTRSKSRTKYYCKTDSSKSSSTKTKNSEHFVDELIKKTEAVSSDDETLLNLSVSCSEASQSIINSQNTQNEPISKRVKIDKIESPLNQINEITSTLNITEESHIVEVVQQSPNNHEVQVTTYSLDEFKPFLNPTHVTFPVTTIVKNEDVVVKVEPNENITKSGDDKEKKKKKKKKKDKLRRSERIKIIETKNEEKKAIEFAEKLQQYQQNDGTTQLKTNVTSPKPFKKMLLTKAFNDEEYVNFETHSVDSSKWPKFDHLDENLFLNQKISFVKETKRMLCDCSTSEQERDLGIQPCGDDCLNRMLMIECGSRCPCGDYCTNKRFQRKQYAFIAPFETPMKGWGVKALEDIKAGTFIIEYIGEVIGLKEFKKRAEKINKNKSEHFYFMSLRNDQIIDASKKGNIARFFNHSCDPNCETQKWTINGELRIGFFARKSIKTDEELTFDYQFQTFGEKQQSCYCGAEKCRGVLGITNSNGTNFDQLWDESEEDEDDDEDDESNAENEQEEERKNKKKKYKKHDDLDLEAQLRNMRSLTTRDSVLKLCQLIFRAENIENRMLILDILLNTTKDTCLKLFMDYHGLDILWSWTVDIDRQHDLKHNYLKLKILNVLEILPIKNRTIVEECKLLSIVKRWHEDVHDEKFMKINDFDSVFENSNENASNEDKKWIESLVGHLIDSVDVKVNFKSSCESIRRKAKYLFEQWSNLQQMFKIPKKQRIEERKEHERELIVNRSMNGNSYDMNQRNNFNRDKIFKTCDNKPKKIQNSSLNQNTSEVKSDEPKMTKEERRLLFEMKVKQDELMKKNTLITNNNTTPETALQNSTPSTTVSLQSPTVHMIQPTQMTHIPPPQSLQPKWIIDTQTGQWKQIYVDDYNPHVMPPQLQQECWSQYYTTPQMSNYYYSTTLPQTSYLQHQQQPIFIAPPPPPPPPPPSQPTLIHIKLEDDDDVPPPPPPTPPKKKEKKLKLPPNWKIAKNDAGRVYYYNKLTKQSQWHLPRENSQKTLINKKPPVKIDTSTEEYKKRKELLREQISKLIIKLLQPYMKDDCKLGRITCTEDFKHLARKFTHTILEKELLRNTNPENTDDFEKRVKIKTKEYIRKYMIKFNAEYSRKNDLDNVTVNNENEFKQENT